MKADDGPHLIRMGVFLTVSVALLLGAIILLGRSQTLFAHRARLQTAFENTSGLVVGAPVRLAGVDIGIVESIRFDKDLRQKSVHVTLVVDRRYLDRVRDDSVARLSSKGLLGDMIINISVGSAEATPLRDGGTLRSQESEGLTEVVTSLQDGITQIRALSATAQERIEHLITDDVARDLGRIAHATADVAEHVQSGGGLAHALIYQPKLARDTAGLVGDARRVASSAQAVLDGVDRLVAEVEHGSGSLHGLVYRDDAGTLMASLSKTVADLDGLLAEVRGGKGLLHSLVYERDRGELLDNLTALSTTLRRLGDEVQQGKGTVGALLKDPSVYEDLKTILGNIERNKLLRAIIRMEIKNDGLRASDPIRARH
jgi:phospholipid/cholesterol/gamma-HCH transport system substrate-binding protein